jgi:hypothetical protein
MMNIIMLSVIRMFIVMMLSIKTLNVMPLSFTKNSTLSKMTFKITALCWSSFRAALFLLLSYNECYYAECHYTDCRYEPYWVSRCHFFTSNSKMLCMLTSMARYLRYSCRAKDFSHEWDKNDMKFGQNQKFEFKKSFVLYRQNYLNVWTKVVLNFVHFAGTKVKEVKSRVHLCSKSPFSTKQVIFDKTLANNLAKF